MFINHIGIEIIGYINRHEIIAVILRQLTKCIVLEHPAIIRPNSY